jgi:AcrR family transcriptional regulator
MAASDRSDSHGRSAGAGDPVADARPGVVDLTGTVDTTRARIVEGAARCVARWGLAKTTIDDIGRESDCSRATVYRYFPGGKDAILLAIGAYEEGRLFSGLAPRLDEAATLEDALTVALTGAATFLAENEVLAYLTVHEPQVLLPHIAFDRIAPLLYRTHAFLAPHLERFVDEAEVRGITEWGTRLVLSYWLEPSPTLDLCRPDDARHLVSRYLLPGLSLPVSTGSTTDTTE